MRIRRLERSSMQKILVAFVLGLSLVFSLGAGCTNKSDSISPVETNSVVIENSTFNPETITISRGSVVSWENKDSLAHQINSDGDLSDFASGLIDQNGKFSFTFDKAGTFKYHCSIHPEMKGNVIVK